MKGMIKGVIFTILMFSTSFFGSLLFLAPLLPLICFAKTEKLGRRLMDNFIFMWKLYAVAVYELFIGIKINIKGDCLPSSNSGQLIILNHRTRFDWLFLMSYQLRYTSLDQLVISLKIPLKYIPGPGWAMQCAGFLFLKRKWELDSVWIRKFIQYFERIGKLPQLLFFPEGTDFSANGIAKSNSFAEKNGLKKYLYLLHPRTTGFVHVVKEMRETKCLNGVLDMSIAFPHYTLQNEGDILLGRFPEEIHFYVKSYDQADIPQNPESIAEWCQQKWAEKEEQLALFYEKKQFPSKDNKLSCDEDKIRQYLYLAILIWSVVLMFSMFMLVYVWYFRIYVLFAICTFTVIQVLLGGVDNILFS